jgi:hypothetical protein
MIIEEMFALQFLFMILIIVVHFVRELLTYWWPVTNEEWEKLNYPERFKTKTLITVAR